MSTILISINPEHVENIIKGTKKYEYRKRVAKIDVKKIIIYCTNPTKKVLAEVEIDNIISGNPEEVWEKTKEFSGISKHFFDKYFENKEVAYAYQLGEVIKYTNPKELNDFGVRYAPQSFIYV